MISSVVKAAGRYLPLIIESVEWQNPMLFIGGMKWKFNTITSWRVIFGSKIAFGYGDDNASEIMSLLLGKELVGISPQSSLVEADPVLIFSDSIKIEIFSSESIEPWSLHLPGGEVFVASPTAENDH